MTHRSRQRVRPRGFTLAEFTVVSGLMALLAVLLSSAWAGLGRPAVDLAARCRVAREANLALASLTRDLGGSLANGEGRLGTKTKYRQVGRLQPSNSQLWLCFDGSDNPNGVADWGPPDTMIAYEVQGSQLIRWDQTNGSWFVVAGYVDRMEVTNLGNQVQIRLTFSYRTVTRTYTLIAYDP